MTATTGIAEPTVPLAARTKDRKVFDRIVAGQKRWRSRKRRQAKKIGLGSLLKF